MGKYASGIVNILNAYQGLEQRVAAIEILISTAEENAQIHSINDHVQAECEGLHDGPAAGIKCRKCYEAELRFPIEAQVEAEFKAVKGGGNEDA
jgi:hypothetical protein